MNDPWLDAWRVPARSVDAGSGWSASHLTSIPGMMQIAQAKNIGNLFEIKDGVPVVRVARGWKPGAEDFLRENSALKWSEKVPTGWHLTNAGPVYSTNPLSAFNETEIASQIEKEFDAVLRPKLDYYYRGTNNKREIDMIKNMSIRRSKNHATGEIEPGLSVSSGPETLWAYDYPYGYKVRGDVAGLGSDGEPTLNINSLNAIGDLKKSSQLMAEWDDMVSKVAADHGISRRPLIGIGARDKIDYLFSDTGKPSIAGATAASADQDEISLDEFLRRYGVTY